METEVLFQERGSLPRKTSHPKKASAQRTSGSRPRPWLRNGPFEMRYEPGFHTSDATRRPGRLDECSPGVHSKPDYAPELDREADERSIGAWDPA